MAFDTRVIPIMIASPSDVEQERRIFSESIDEWNAAHGIGGQFILMPIKWETHSAPELGSSGQEIINERLLSKADLLVGVFWSRIGTPTNNSISGSVEEIESFFKAGKPVSLYFSTEPLPQPIDNEQYSKLQKFKSWARERGLVEEYATKDEFRRKLVAKLPIVLRENNHIKRIVRAGIASKVSEKKSPPQFKNVDEDMLSLIEAAAASEHGMVLFHQTVSDTHIRAGEKDFTAGKPAREIARWRSAFERLRARSFIQAEGRDPNICVLTDEAYRLLD